MAKEACGGGGVEGVRRGVEEVQRGVEEENVVRTGMRRRRRWLSRIQNLLTCTYVVIKMDPTNVFPF